MSAVDVCRKLVNVNFNLSDVYFYTLESNLKRENLSLFMYFLFLSARISLPI